MLHFDVMLYDDEVLCLLLAFSFSRLLTISIPTPIFLLANSYKCLPGLLFKILLGLENLITH